MAGPGGSTVSIWNGWTRGVIELSRKSFVMFGMVVGSVAGGYVPALFGASTFSMAGVGLSMLGGIVGIVVAYKVTQ